MSAAAFRPLRPAPCEIARRGRGLPRLVVDVVALGECLAVEIYVELDVDLSGSVARAAGLERGGVGLCGSKRAVSRRDQRDKAAFVNTGTSLLEVPVSKREEGIWGPAALTWRDGQ